MSKNLLKQVSQIQGFDVNDRTHKQYQWVTHYKQREDYLKGIRDQGLKGNDYSEAVIAFDQQYTTQSMFN